MIIFGQIKILIEFIKRERQYHKDVRYLKKTLKNSEKVSKDLAKRIRDDKKNA